MEGFMIDKLGETYCCMNFLVVWKLRDLDYDKWGQLKRYIHLRKPEINLKKRWDIWDLF